MNTNTFFRTTMATSYSARKFFKKVVSDLQAQLTQWDVKTDIQIEVWRSYVVNVKYLDQTYRVALSKNEIDLLQHESPYSLDQKIWLELMKQGLQMRAAEGNFLQQVFVQQPNYRIS